MASYPTPSMEVGTAPKWMTPRGWWQDYQGHTGDTTPYSNSLDNVLYNFISQNKDPYTVAQSLRRSQLTGYENGSNGNVDAYDPWQQERVWYVPFNSVYGGDTGGGGGGGGGNGGVGSFWFNPLSYGGKLRV